MGKHRSARKETGATKKDKNSGLGSALNNAQRRDRAERKEQATTNHTADFIEEYRGHTVKSVVDEGDFVTLVAKAVAEGKEFAKREDAKLLDAADFSAETATTPSTSQLQYMTERRHLLRIPRRPAWSASMTKQELQSRETESFYLWRAELARLEQESVATVTPFEKNIQMWRQLWRVVERSDILFQVVDARNPLLFRCADLVRYMQEISLRQKRPKRSILLLNKADLVPVQARRVWSAFFSDHKIEHVWFSALREETMIKLSAATQHKEHAEIAETEKQLRLGGIELEDVILSSLRDPSDHNDVQDGMKPPTTPGGSDLAAAPDASTIKNSISAEVNVRQDDADESLPFNLATGALRLCSSVRVLTRSEILSLIGILTTQMSETIEKFLTSHGLIGSSGKVSTKAPSEGEDVESTSDRQPIVVGMCGYPNVGKSSVINVLAIETGIRTAVGPTPGKTKHFQTIQLSRSITLCDCPGLVFPSFTHCRADLVCNGILPIDHERDYMASIRLLAARIPARVFEKIYGIEVHEPDRYAVKQMPSGANPAERYGTAEMTLDAIATKRGFTQSYGGPDRSRVSRMLMKDLLGGKLLWIALPSSESIGVLS